MPVDEICKIVVSQVLNLLGGCVVMIVTSGADLSLAPTMAVLHSQVKSRVPEIVEAECSIIE